MNTEAENPRSAGPSVSVADVVAAHARISSGIYLSPCHCSIPLSELTGSDVFCKLDYLQRTGSFKERGARNALLRLIEGEHAPDRVSGAPSVFQTGVIAASAGNHALGLAYHGGLLGIPVTVVMPKHAPLIKVETCRRLGAHIVLHGTTYQEARQHASLLATERGIYEISGINNPDVVAGQGTMGLEILDQIPEFDAVVVPVGGGSLIAGLSLAVKSMRPQVRVIGVEPDTAASMGAAFRAGGPVEIPPPHTIADGLAVAKVGDIAYEIARRNIDEIVTVTEDEIALAILRLIELEKAVVEGAAAASLAAVMTGKLPELAGRRVVICLSGGNIDPAILCRVIERGLVADGRLCRFSVVISDRPGGLAELTAIVAAAGASVKEIHHERVFAGESDVSAVQVECVLETRDHAHVREIHELLREKRFRLA